jgi:polar amino acid transport system substrate-binding protein
MRRALLVVLLVAGFAATASARTLAQIKAFNTLSVCLPANSLPFSSRRDNPPGFQVELAEALGKRLGVMVEQDWVISPLQAMRANCDLLLDVIADPEAQGESHLQLSKPYYRSGVALALPPGSAITSFAGLDEHSKVAVQVGSIVAMLLGQRHVPLSTFAFEDEMLQALSDKEVTAAAVSAISAAYFNHAHPQAQLVVRPPDEAEQQLVWNIAIGMRRPDKALREAIDDAIDAFVADGTIARIYGRYGITLLPPK